jgi:hypothetical protein
MDVITANWPPTHEQVATEVARYCASGKQITVLPAEVVPPDCRVFLHEHRNSTTDAHKGMASDDIGSSHAIRTGDSAFLQHGSSLELIGLAS